MVKLKKTRSLRQGQAAGYRGPAAAAKPKDDSTSPADPPPSDLDVLRRAEVFAAWSDQRLVDAEEAAIDATEAAEKAQAIAREAVKVARMAEDAAQWVLNEAQAMVDAARARVDIARSIAEAEGEAAADSASADTTLGRAVGYADDGRANALRQSYGAVDRAMLAVSRPR